jgi:hypothetical protein
MQYAELIAQIGKQAAPHPKEARPARPKQRAK